MYKDLINSKYEIKVLDFVMDGWTKEFDLKELELELQIMSKKRLGHVLEKFIWFGLIMQKENGKYKVNRNTKLFKALSEADLLIADVVNKKYLE